MLSQQVGGRQDLRGVERAARHGVLVPVLDALHAPPAGPLDLHAQLEGERLVLQPPDDRGAVERPCERARAPVTRNFPAERRLVHRARSPPARGRGARSAGGTGSGRAGAGAGAPASTLSPHGGKAMAERDVEVWRNSSSSRPVRLSHSLRTHRHSDISSRRAARNSAMGRAGARRT
jgi:hypothetical protein